MAEKASDAQQPATAVETTSPTEPHAMETQASTNTLTQALKRVVSDPVNNQDNAQETLLSISEMLEENAKAFRSDEKGKKMLLQRESIFNRPGQDPYLVLPPEQEDGTTSWKPDDSSLVNWEAYHTKPPTPAGQIWWVVATHNPNKSGVGQLFRRPRHMRVAEAVLLIECLLQGDIQVEDVNYDMSSFEEHNMHVFVCSYIKPSRSEATISLCDTYGIQAMHFGGRRLPELDILHLQYHLVYLTYVPILFQARKLESLSKDKSKLILERRSGKIEQLSHSQPQRAAVAARRLKPQPSYEVPEHFEECRFSTSLQLYGKGGEFRLVLVGDAGARVNFDPREAFEENKTSSSLRFDPNSLGHLAGLTHFLIILVHLLDTWYEGWKETLNTLDSIVGFELDHTFDDEQLERHIFDTSESMDLSKQYFTTLQLLRIARQQIENNLVGWEELRELPANERAQDRLHRPSSIHDRVLSTLDKFVLSEGGVQVFKVWEEQRDRVTQLFKTRAKHLTERIDQKTKEVESLRDGLFNATSLREAMKGMALNRAIYLFTAVTIIFTPLSFLTALWALPILNTTPEGGSIRPSSTAFLATFIIIPVLTYVICGYFAWYLVSTKTWKACANFFRGLLENIYFVLDVGAKYASYPFSKSTQKACEDYVQYPPEDAPAWVLKAIKWLVGAGEDSSERATV